MKYSNDIDTLLQNGIELEIKMNNGIWRDICSISTGQKTLVALSLCFAIQNIQISFLYYYVI